MVAGRAAVDGAAIAFTGPRRGADRLVVGERTVGHRQGRPLTVDGSAGRAFGDGAGDGGSVFAAGGQVVREEWIP